AVLLTWFMTGLKDKLAEQKECINRQLSAMPSKHWPNRAKRLECVPACRRFRTTDYRLLTTHHAIRITFHASRIMPQIKLIPRITLKDRCSARDHRPLGLRRKLRQDGLKLADHSIQLARLVIKRHRDDHRQLAGGRPA